MQIIKLIGQVVAPYRVEFTPQSANDAGQVIPCWTFNDALAWTTCALNSDLVTIYNKYSGRIAARRNSI